MPNDLMALILQISNEIEEISDRDCLQKLIESLGFSFEPHNSLGHPGISFGQWLFDELSADLRTTALYVLMYEMIKKGITTLNCDSNCEKLCKLLEKATAILRSNIYSACTKISRDNDGSAIKMLLENYKNFFKNSFEAIEEKMKKYNCNLNPTHNLERSENNCCKALRKIYNQLSYIKNLLNLINDLYLKLIKLLEKGCTNNTMVDIIDIKQRIFDLFNKIAIIWKELQDTYKEAESTCNDVIPRPRELPNPNVPLPLPQNPNDPNFDPYPPGQPIRPPHNPFPPSLPGVVPQLK